MWLHDPGLFTSTMPAIVMPRNTSSETSLEFDLWSSVITFYAVPMECAGRAKRRRRFGCSLVPVQRPSKAASRYDCHRTPNYLGAFRGRGPRPNSSGFGSVEVVSYFRSASSMARLLANQSEII